MTQIARAQRSQGRLALPDLMPDLQRIQDGAFGSEGFLGRGRDRGLSQQAVATTVENN
jgi:hypothetical protein